MSPEVSVTGFTVLVSVSVGLPCQLWFFETDISDRPLIYRFLFSFSLLVFRILNQDRRQRPEIHSPDISATVFFGLTVRFFSPGFFLGISVPVFSTGISVPVSVLVYHPRYTRSGMIIL